MRDHGEPGTEATGAATPEAIELLRASLGGDAAELARLVASSPDPHALLVATASLAAALTRTVAIYGDLSAEAALDLLGGGTGSED